jgi:hypothetical protein
MGKLLRAEMPCEMKGIGGVIRKSEAFDSYILE